MPDPLLSEPPKDIEVWRKQSDIDKINDLKKYCMKGFPDISLHDCYQKAIDLSEYFDCVVSILAIIHSQIPKDDSTLSKATRAFVTAVNTGLVKFWTAINQGAADLLRDCKYGEACAVTVPVPPRGTGEAGKDYPASPGTPGKGAAAEPDRLEPEHPIEVFIAVYEVLEKLDSLMRKRGEVKRQRLIAAGGDVDPPADLGLQRPTDVQLWKLLERSASRGGSRYVADIARPLRQPLHDRAEQLVQGTIQLSGDAASGDILKLLTSAIAKSGITSPVYYALPDAAIAAASIQNISDKETKLSVVPEAISDLFSDQEAFENVRFDLLTRLLPPQSRQMAATQDRPPRYHFPRP